MKTVLAIIAASLLAFSVPAQSRDLFPQRKCHPQECHVHAVPIETGKGSCKAHPGSCK